MICRLPIYTYLITLLSFRLEMNLLARSLSTIPCPRDEPFDCLTNRIVERFCRDNSLMVKNQSDSTLDQVPKRPKLESQEPYIEVSYSSSSLVSRFASPSTFTPVKESKQEQGTRQAPTLATTANGHDNAHEEEVILEASGLTFGSVSTTNLDDEFHFQGAKIVFGKIGTPLILRLEGAMTNRRDYIFLVKRRNANKDDIMST
jgi:hypothetical protein